MSNKMSYSSYSIPNPAVVFTRESTNPFWERRRKRAADAINPNVVSTEEDYTKLMGFVGTRLITLGMIERQKEMNLIRAACPDFAFSDTKEFIAAFNTIMQGKRQTEESIARIKAAQEKMKNSDKKAPAPHIAALFAPYFQTTLTEEIRKFINGNLDILIRDPDAFGASWTSQYSIIVDTAVNRAMKKMLNAAGKDAGMYGMDADFAKELINLYNTLPEFSQQFRNMIKSKMATSLANLKKDLLSDNVLQKIKQGKKKPGLSTVVEKKLNLGNRRGSIGGSVYEYIQTMINMKGTITEHGTTVVGGEGVKTDMISVFNFTGNPSVSLELMNDLNATLSASHSLQQARTNLEQFYQRNFSKLNDQFIVYTSAKLYGLTSLSSGFKNGIKQSLETLPDYVSSAGLSVGNARDFLATAYNTVDGAIYEGLQGQLKDNLRVILTSAVAKMLFDDFSTIGTSSIGGTSGQAIHAFALNGVYLPSSELFIQLGRSLERTAADFTKWVNINVHISYAKKDPRYNNDNVPDSVAKPAIFEAWNHNIESARRSSYFTVNFLANFNSIFNSLF